MKTFLKVLLGIVAVIALAIAAVFWFSRALPSAADGFFAALKAHDGAKAQSYLSSGFKAASDDAALARFVAANGLADVAATSWPGRNVSTQNGNTTGLLDGKATLGDGRVVALKIAFVKEAGEWKIQTIDTPSAGLLNDGRPVSAAKPPLPDAAERSALVKQTLHDFFVSIAAKDMTHFYSTISALWQKQTDPKALEAAFKSVMDVGNDWSVIDPLEPQFDGDAGIADDGTLHITGHYATHPAQLDFTLRYVREGAAWKPIAVNIKLH